MVKCGKSAFGPGRTYNTGNYYCPIQKDGKQKPAGFIYHEHVRLCFVSVFQICNNDHLVKIKDWSALSDTSEAVVSGALNLLLGTILFNVIALVICYGKKADRK